MLQVLAIAFVAITFTTGLLRPMIALAALVCMFPMEQLLQANVPWFLDRSSSFNIMCGLLAVGAVCLQLLRRPDTLIGTLNGTTLSVYGLFLFGALSLLWTRNPAWAVETVKNGTPYALVLLVLAPLLINDIPGLRALSKGVLIIGLAIAAQLMMNPNLELYTARLVFGLDAARKSNPLAIGTLGGTLLVIAVMTNFGRSPWWLGVRIAAAFSGLGLALLSGSRGQVMAAVVVSVLFYPMSRRISDYKRFFTTVAGFVVLAGVGYLALKFFVGHDNEDRWSSESLLYGGSGRMENAVDLITAWLKHPEAYLIGLGYFSFDVMPNRTGDGYSHVMIADAIGELGLIGITLYALVYFFAIRAIIRLFRRHHDQPVERSMIAAFAALLAYSFFLQNKQGTLFGVDTGWVYAMILTRVELRERLFPPVETYEDDASAYDDADEEEHFPAPQELVRA